MIASSIILFLAAFSSGLLGLWVTVLSKKATDGFLIFAGGYLFAVTVIHVLPELYHFGAEKDSFTIGVIVLGGFFFQQILEFFTHGVEHGHMHEREKSHHHSALSPLYVMVALGMHAFLEGTILTGERNTLPILLGIILHKVPAAFALVSILSCQISKTSKIILLLLLFSLASPLGILVGNLLISAGVYMYLFALVTGGFLHISTTIVFESVKDHKFNTSKLIWSLMGAITAILTEVIFL
ncbi:MAG: ZIP family metal transporter [Cyclobacteriaceae bacterium]|nr:ZIP family metal transporter [Cyclobacteriaceae bacterium]